MSSTHVPHILSTSLPFRADMWGQLHLAAAPDIRKNRFHGKLQLPEINPPKHQLIINPRPGTIIGPSTPQPERGPLPLQTTPTKLSPVPTPAPLAHRSSPALTARAPQSGTSAAAAVEPSSSTASLLLRRPARRSACDTLTVILRRELLTSR